MRTCALQGASAMCGGRRKTFNLSIHQGGERWEGMPAGVPAGCRAWSGPSPCWLPASPRLHMHLCTAAPSCTEARGGSAWPPKCLSCCCLCMLGLLLQAASNGCSHASRSDAHDISSQWNQTHRYPAASVGVMRCCITQYGRPECAHGSPDVCMESSLSAGGFSLALPAQPLHPCLLCLLQDKLNLGLSTSHHVYLKHSETKEEQ